MGYLLITNDIDPYYQDVVNIMAQHYGSRYRFRYERTPKAPEEDLVGKVDSAALKQSQGLIVFRQWKTGRLVPIRRIYIENAISSLYLLVVEFFLWDFPDPEARENWSLIEDILKRSGCENKPSSGLRPLVVFADDTDLRKIRGESLPSTGSETAEHLSRWRWTIENIADFDFMHDSCFLYLHTIRDESGRLIGGDQIKEGRPNLDAGEVYRAEIATYVIGDPGRAEALDPNYFDYDAAGDLIKDGLRTFKYDAENRVTHLDGSPDQNYFYDGAGLRVKKVVGSTTTRYIFSGTKVIAEYTGATPALSKEYIYAGSQLLATIAGSTITYHHADHLSVRVNTDSTGIKVGEQGHYPFGESWYSINSTTKWQFTSYERDSESGLDYAMFRYDSTRLGRFMTPDPLAGTRWDPQSLNRYSYVRNDPVNLIDPLGLGPECLISRAPIENDGTLSSCAGGPSCFIDGAPVPCMMAFRVNPDAGEMFMCELGDPCSYNAGPPGPDPRIRIGPDGTVYMLMLVPIPYQTGINFGATCQGDPCTLSVTTTAYRLELVRVGTISDESRGFPRFIPPRGGYRQPRTPGPRILPGDPIPRGAPGPNTPFPPTVRGPYIQPAPNLPLWKRLLFVALQGLRIWVAPTLVLMPDPCELDPKAPGCTIY